MLAGLGCDTMKSDTRRQTIEIASRKILEGFVEGGGATPGGKKHPNA